MIVSSNQKLKISVLGAGSWGSTLAWLLSTKYSNITIWTFSKEEYTSIKKSNSLLKPKKIMLNKNIKITTDLPSVVKSSDVIIIAVPTIAFKQTILKIKELKINSRTILLSATKGINPNDNSRPSQIIRKYLPKNPFAVLSGPNIALDVVSKAPIISVVATENIAVGNLLQELLSTSHFRIYINKDVNGVEVAGALKNVIAIAAGMSDGFGFNISTKAALISRGLLEITRITIKEGGNPKTLLGAAGIGDLIATCCSTNSRNYRVGFSIAQGKSLTSVLKDIGQVAEGVETVKSMLKLAKKYRIKVPIANAVYDIVIKEKQPKLVLKSLLSRSLTKHELEF